MLRSGDTFINEPFIIASAFVVLIFAGSHRHFVSGRARHRIPAFGFRRRFKDCLVRAVSGSSVNSRLACSQSDFDTFCAERPSMAASSTARSRTILRVTVPRPAEFSVKAPCFSGFVFMGLNDCKSGKAFQDYALFLSGACHDLRAGHGIERKCYPAFDPGWRP